MKKEFSLQKVFKPIDSGVATKIIFPKLHGSVKFIYSEKATKFCEISTVDWSVTTSDKSTVEILQKFVAFSEYMNFNIRLSSLSYRVTPK